MKKTVDVTPHPRILQVVGEIDFKPSQCVAELVDNAIDGFLKVDRAGTPIRGPLVQVAVGRDTVVVKDNGPGMSADDLELAVTAGWTSNERFGNLGLYGVGFNIATARLGKTTTIWTTRAGDAEWAGVSLDLPQMERGRTYTLELRTRPKAERKVSGTEIEISTLRAEWRDDLANPAWLKKNVTERLARIYGAMLRERNAAPIKFSLQVNNRAVRGWEHCVWAEDRTVFRKADGLVHPVVEIDRTFGTKYVSRATGESFDSADGLDPDDVIEVPERVYGWLGVQRYVDENDYGLDVLRNGRKIEIGCKDLFAWENPDGTVTPEYPIDEQRHRRGRIVGEIHLDHGYVHYTKHRFEREHSSWTQLLLAVKHNEPLVHRDKSGYQGVNTSPLGLLHRTFRRNTPSANQKYADILIIPDNDLAKRWAADFRRTEANARDDDAWYAEVERGDAAEADSSSAAAGVNGGPAVDAQATPSDPLDPSTPGALDGPAAAGPSAPNADPPLSDVARPPRTPTPGLNLHVTNIGPSGRAYDVEVYAVEAASAGPPGSPWRTRATARGVYEVEVDREHAAFQSSSLQLQDALLAEVAHLVTSEENATAGSPVARYADVLVALRARHSTADSLAPNALRLEIEDVRRRLTTRLERALPGEAQRALVDLLPPSDVHEIDLARARGPADASDARYFTPAHLALVLAKQPAALFEAGCFNQSWTPLSLRDSPLLDEHRRRLAADVWLPMYELGAFMAAPSETYSRPHLALVRACVNRLREFLPTSDDGARDLR